jgi:hypothetical protein
MPDAKGRPRYSDFETPEAVEAVLVTAPKRLRAILLTWEYALLRAQAAGKARPGFLELSSLQRRILYAWSIVPALQTAAYVWLFLLFGYTFVADWSRGGPPPKVVPLAIATGLALLMFGVFVARQYGRRARAGRLVWRSLNVNSEERRAMLAEAVRIELERA